MQTEHLLPDPNGMARAASLLAQGQVVAIPTETVYGLAGDARNGTAVARIYAAKGRPSFNPLIVHVADLDAARAIATVTPEAERLADAHWPGALTLVLPLRPEAGIASLVTAGLTTIALRIPAHPTAQALLRLTGPLAAPSANASGRSRVARPSVQPTMVDSTPTGQGPASRTAAMRPSRPPFGSRT